jgi:hypothetical protein
VSVSADAAGRRTYAIRPAAEAGGRASRSAYDARGTDAFDAAGVDVTLIDWMLSLTPPERLEALFVHATSMVRLSPSAESD